jgi:anaerobic magnesium-protoporphyrin IX monomethyl ester cyclase
MRYSRHGSDQVTTPPITPPDRSNLRLLFVNCCLRRHSSTKVLPVGLGYVMTYVHERGYTNHDLLDIDINDLDDAAVQTYLEQHSYDVILLGTLVTHYKWVKWFLQVARRLQPEATLVVGNSVAGSIFQLFLDKTPADVVVIGEGEVSTYEALEAMRLGQPLAGVEGIAFRDEAGTVVKTTKRKAALIDTLPMPNWDFFDVPRYIEKSAHTITYGTADEDAPRTIPMPISTARGCAFRCTFCHFVFWDDPYRLRSPEGVLAEIRRNRDKYGANYANFWDDLSFSSLLQVERMCDAILASDLRFHWMASIRCDLFGRERLPYERRRNAAEKMKAAGCVAVGFSLESGDPDILEMMNKKIDASFFIEQVHLLREVGIVCNTSVVFGYPIETPATIQQTFDLCLQARVYPSIGFLLPLPYTGMYEYAKQHGFITDEDAYLESITERQDICLNMTTMTDVEIMDEIKKGASKLNDALALGLDEDRLIKTGGYKKATNVKDFAKPPFDPANVKRNENDFSFNYSDAAFEVDAGVGRVRKD